MANDFSKITIDGTTYNVKVPNKLTVGSKTFDGSSAVTIAASDLGLSNALQFVGETTETPLSDGSTTSSVKIGSTTHTAATGDVVLYGAKEFVWQGSMWKELGDGSSHALKTISISAGSGLTGGGTLEANRTISHADTSSQASVTASGRRYITGVTLDGYGHVTGLTTGTETVTAPTTPSEVGAAPKTAGVYLVKGNTAGTAGTWTGDSSDFTDYYDGLVVAYDIGIAGASTTTLNINGKGAKTVYLRGTTKLTTHYAVGTIILLVYSADADCWYKADYDANTNTQVRVYRQDASGYNKDYPLIASRTVAADLGTVGTESSYEAVYGLISDTAANIPTTNPYTGESKFKTVTAITFKGALDGNATTATTTDNATKLGGQVATYYAAASSVPTKTSQLTNDSGFKTTDNNTTYSLSKSGSTITLTGSDGSTTSVTDANTTYSNATTSTAGLMSKDDKAKLDGIASGANNYTYTLPAATSSTLGGVKTGSNITNSSGTISLTKANVTSALGYTPPTTNTTYSNATTSAAGLMSAADKTKLDSTFGANAITDFNMSSGTTTATEVNTNGIKCATDELEIEFNGGTDYNYCVGNFTVPIVAGSNIAIVKNDNGMAGIYYYCGTWSSGISGTVKLPEAGTYQVRYGNGTTSVLYWNGMSAAHSQLIRANAIGTCYRFYVTASGTLTLKTGSLTTTTETDTTYTIYYRRMGMD